MGVMTAQQVLPMTMVPGVVRVGAAADLLEDSGGGEVFIHGNLTYAWSGDDQALRRLTAVQLVEMQVAKVGDVADACAERCPRQRASSTPATLATPRVATLRFWPGWRIWRCSPPRPRAPPIGWRPGGTGSSAPDRCSPPRPRSGWRGCSWRCPRWRPPAC